MTLASVLCAMLRPLLGRLRAFRAERRDRQVLASLDPRLLRDLGLDRTAIEDDSTEGFWR